MHEFITFISFSRLFMIGEWYMYVIRVTGWCNSDVARQSTRPCSQYVSVIGRLCSPPPQQFGGWGDEDPIDFYFLCLYAMFLGSRAKTKKHPIYKLNIKWIFLLFFLIRPRVDGNRTTQKDERNLVSLFVWFKIVHAYRHTNKSMYTHTHTHTHMYMLERMITLSAETLLYTFTIPP